MTTIPAPCPEDWDAMSLAIGGRHCARCDRVVIDLTRSAPSQAADVLVRARLVMAGCFSRKHLDVCSPMELPRFWR
jgi:hypothetical protein